MGACQKGGARAQGLTEGDEQGAGRRVGGSQPVLPLRTASSPDPQGRRQSLNLRALHPTHAQPGLRGTAVLADPEPGTPRASPYQARRWDSCSGSGAARRDRGWRRGRRGTLRTSGGRGREPLGALGVGTEGDLAKRMKAEPGENRPTRERPLESRWRRRGTAANRTGIRTSGAAP